MENKQSYNLSVVFTKLKCSTDFFSDNIGSGGNCIIHHWMLILTKGICGVMMGASCVGIKWRIQYES